MSDEIGYSWRGPVSDDELVEVHGGRPAVGWWHRICRHSLGRVTARDRVGVLVGFVNVGVGRWGPRVPDRYQDPRRLSAPWRRHGKSCGELLSTRGGCAHLIWPHLGG